MKIIKKEPTEKNIINWHEYLSEEVLKILETGQEGLNQSEAQKRLNRYGLNHLPKAPRPGALIRFFLHFHNVLIYVLIVSALITAILGHWVDMGVIIAVVLVNAMIGYIQEGKAEMAMEAIQQMLALKAAVLRSGQRISLDAKKIVPGDIVFLEAGDKVPADLRILKSHNLQVQEAILTGESVPVEKNTNAVKKDVPLGDRSCMMFSGTLVTNGQGKGVVVATGTHSEIGRISGLLSDVETLKTPLIAQMNVFANWLTMLILLIAGLLLSYGYFISHHDFTEMFMAVVGLSVAAIPEGLPAVLTITLAIGVQAMAKRNAIIRRLPAIETLGSVSVICTDKTGTLTHNEMMVSSVLDYQHCFTIEGDGYIPEGAVKLENTHVSPSKYNILKELAHAAALCNNATLRQQDGAWVVEGDPMEGALLAFASKIDADPCAIQAKWKRTDSISFDSKHRFMATLNHDQESQAFVYVKGAPEKVLGMCANQRNVDGNTEALDPAYWNAQTKAIATLGQRVLAFSVKQVNPEHNILNHEDVKGSMTLLGMVGLIDPPRSEAITAIKQCHGAGIRVKMVTGDHAQTAAAIGKQIGLQNPDKVLTGIDLDHMDDGMLRQVILNCDIFARTTPEHKLRLVKALQSHGMTVAMTGDGVNDAPALKRADAGIAMGCKGSEAAKEAADIVLADDNFASIALAVREGRTVYDNIKKVVSWTLPTSAGEAITIIFALLLGMTLPVTPVQILWINLITASTLGIALAFEPTEENTMHRPPRKRDEPILSGALIWHIVLVSILFLCGVFGIYAYAINRGYSIELARTLAVNTLVVMEIFHLFFIRNIYGNSLTWKAIRGTKVVWLTIIVVTAGQFAITYLPLLQTVFDTKPIQVWDGLLIIGIGILLFVIIEVEKQIRLKYQHKEMEI